MKGRGEHWTCKVWGAVEGGVYGGECCAPPQNICLILVQNWPFFSKKFCVQAGRGVAHCRHKYATVYCILLTCTLHTFVPIIRLLYPCKGHIPREGGLSSCSLNFYPPQVWNRIFWCWILFLSPDHNVKALKWVRYLVSLCTKLYHLWRSLWQLVRLWYFDAVM